MAACTHLEQSNDGSSDPWQFAQRLNRARRPTATYGSLHKY